MTEYLPPRRVISKGEDMSRSVIIQCDAKGQMVTSSSKVWWSAKFSIEDSAFQLDLKQ